MRPHLAFDVPLMASSVALLAGGLPWAAAGCVVAGAGLHAWAVVHPRSRLYLPVIWRLPATAPLVALTFDDGPDPEVTPRLLDLLAAQGARATFFVVGVHARAHGALLRRMRDEGHALGLHSDAHSRWFNTWRVGRVVTDLEANAAAIADATGVAAPRLFRPPVGLKNPQVAEAVRRLNLVCVTWTARGRDTGTATPAIVAARLRRGLLPGGILTLHDGYEPGRPRRRDTCLAVLPLVLAEARSRGLRPCALAVEAQRVVPLD